MSEALHARLRHIRARLAVRSWEYRQRHYSKGVWYRVRRALTEADRAFAVSSAVVDELKRQGHVPLPAGHELVPPRTWFLIEPDELPPSSSLGPPLKPKLDDRLLAAEGVVLVRFDDLCSS